MTFFTLIIHSPVFNKKNKKRWETFLSKQHFDNYEVIFVTHNVDNHFKNKFIFLRDEKAGVLNLNKLNLAIQKSSGKYIIFLEGSDTLEVGALKICYEIIMKNNYPDCLYSDCTTNNLVNYKPDWSPDTLLSFNYIGQLFICRRGLLYKNGGFKNQGSPFYDLIIRCATKADKVIHISKNLCKVYITKKKTSMYFSEFNSEIEIKHGILKNSKIDANIIVDQKKKISYPIYGIKGNPKVSIIIPSKNHYDTLRRCIASIKEANYVNYEIIVVDNGSRLDEKSKIEILCNSVNAKYCYKKNSFNFSKMCNIGANISSGDFLLFLNDDVEFTDKNTIAVMVGQCQQKRTGAVGIKLYYPNTTIIQHAGVSNRTIGPSHDFYRFDDKKCGYLSMNWINRNCLCVTGACLLIKKTIFNSVNGFDEHFPVAYNDADLCFRIHKKGFYNVVLNTVNAIHHESMSRGLDSEDEQKISRLNEECAKLFKKHKDLYKIDPFLNINFINYPINTNITTKHYQKIVAFLNRHLFLKRVIKKIIRR